MEGLSLIPGHNWDCVLNMQVVPVRYMASLVGPYAVWKQCARGDGVNVIRQRAQRGNFDVHRVS